MRNRFGHRIGSPNCGNFKFVGQSNLLSSNPYEALATQSLQDKSITRPLNWRIILISIVICFGVGCVVGIGFGIIAFALAFTLGSSITTYIGSPIFMVAGLIVGLVPSVVGAFYLGRHIESRWLAHASIYSIANLLITFLFMLIPSESGTPWTDIAYCVLLVPVGISCVAFATRLR